MSRTADVQELESMWGRVKKEKFAFMQVPPYADPSQSGPPQQGGPPQGQPMPQGPPQGQPTQGPPPGPPQGAPQGPPPGMPQDPSQGQPQGPPQQPAGPAPVNPEMAGVMDQVVKKVEDLAHGQQQQNAELHQRVAKLEQELAHERDKRGERQKIISALLPAT